MSAGPPVRRAVAALLALALIAPVAGMTEGPVVSADAPVVAPAYSAKGADTCLKCHDEDSEVPVLPIFKTRHARPADARTPFAGHQCESCHGPGDTHARGGNDDPVPPIRSFGLREATPVAEQNGVCLDCHAGGHRSGWIGSAHETADVPCASCHQVHAAQDRVLAKSTEPEVCFSCHRQQHADSLKPSGHLRLKHLACTSCHAVHGAPGDALATGASTNETCYRCHADKRGPFLWEHAPVAEDCAQCHVPHGSNTPSLLVQRAPLLCQGCHAPAGHPSVAYTGAGLPGGTASGFLLGQGCASCHSQVHGSNHPSGGSLSR